MSQRQRSFVTLLSSGFSTLSRLAGRLRSRSPKAALRASFQIGILDETEARLGIAMVDDRNLTVHTYNEDLAEEIYGRLASYSGLMNSWLEAMTRQLQEVD